MGWLEHCLTGGCQNIGTGATTCGYSTEHHSQRLLHVHPEHQRVRLGSRSVVGDHPERMDRLVDGHIQLDVIFNGLCDGSFDPEACNFEPTATIANNDLCEYAIDYYPSGLYDCDGNCYLDFDGDLICNELEVPGCQEPWACNYNPQATDPPLPGFPCLPPKRRRRLRRQQHVASVLDQPQDLTVSCENIPEPSAVATQAAPAAIAYTICSPTAATTIQRFRSTTRPTRSLAIALATTHPAQLAHHGLHGVPEP